MGPASWRRGATSGDAPLSLAALPQSGVSALPPHHIEPCGFLFLLFFGLNRTKVLTSGSCPKVLCGAVLNKMWSCSYLFSLSSPLLTLLSLLSATFVLCFFMALEPAALPRHRAGGRTGEGVLVGRGDRRAGGTEYLQCFISACF